MLMSLACVQDSPDDTNRIYGKDSVHLPRLNEQRLVRRHLPVKPAVDEREDLLVRVGERRARHAEERVRHRRRVQPDPRLGEVRLERLDDRPDRGVRDRDAL